MGKPNADKKMISSSPIRAPLRPLSSLYIPLLIAQLLKETSASFSLFLRLMHFIYLFLFPFLSIAPVPSLFSSGVDYSDFTASPGLSTGADEFEPIKLEIPSPVAGNTAPPDIVEGEGNPSGVQSDPEIVPLAVKPKKDTPTPTPTPTPNIFGPPIRQNPNVPEEAWDAYAGYPQPSDLPDLYISGTQTLKPQTRGLCLKGKELFCCRWGSHTYLSTGKTTRGPIKCFKCRFLRRSIPPPTPAQPPPHSPW